jgi:hypothetical protein
LISIISSHCYLAGVSCQFTITLLYWELPTIICQITTLRFGLMTSRHLFILLEEPLQFHWFIPLTPPWYLRRRRWPRRTFARPLPYFRLLLPTLSFSFNTATLELAHAPLPSPATLKSLVTALPVPPKSRYAIVFNSGEWIPGEVSYIVHD